MKHIDPARWQRIEALFDEALERDAQDRAAWVREQAGDDAELAQQVLDMLKASGEAATFLESTSRNDLEDALARMASVVEEENPEGSDPERAGPYRLIRKLGRGGMGQVYLGVRDDEAYKRYVAVKVIRRGMDTEDILKRFRVERRILASLNHPGIAQLLDGGSTDEGVSYFVMEYVDGDSITKYCDEHRLSLQERLRLFQKVCAAVHYAHQNLIVHRDLKPSNILVTRDGEVKLLDFGIAKFLNPDLTGYTLPMTRDEQRVMTPEYASPEQVRGNSFTTASDVYQLGVLLYELLTGHRPFTFQTRVQGEIEKIILEQAPEKPSTMVSKVVDAKEVAALTAEQVSQQRRTPLANLRKQLAGDLDRIVLMALRKEQDRRYQSADQLQKDIGFYLVGRPVTAQDDTLAYRVGKFVQRNKLAVGSAALVLVLLVVITIVAVRSAVVTEQQREQIALEVEKSREVIDFLVDLFEAADPEFAQGRDVTVREMVDIGAEEVRERLADHPDVQSEMMRVLSLVYAGLGEEDEGMALAEAAWDAQVSLAGDRPTPGLASAAFAMGVLKNHVSERDASRAFHQQALAMRRELYGEQHLDVAQSLNGLGVTLHGMNLYDSTRVVWEQALAIRRDLLGPSHRDIAESLSNLGAVFGDLYYLSDPREADLFTQAEAYYTEALEMTRRERGENHPFYASNLHNFGLTLLDRGVLQEAETKFSEAIEKRTLIYGRFHDATARSLNMMGRVRVQQGRLDEADPYFKESLDIHVALLGPRHPTVGIDHVQLANLDRERGMLDEAVGHYLEAFSVLQESLGAQNRRTIDAARRLGQTLEAMQRLGEATRYLEAVVGAIPVDGPTSGQQVSDLIALARVQLQTGRR
ncbi:MAG: serine/threonine-protein kinase, partial [Bacteroidetes bacterium]|nr:serine/threonine-protein kinase [Bacteroidota bacterium]